MPGAILKNKKWIAYLISGGLAFQLNMPPAARAESQPVLESYLRARDDLRYQADYLLGRYNELARLVETKRRKIKTNYYGQDDRKKARAEIVQAIYELQRRLQAIDAENTDEKKDMYDTNTDLGELEATLSEVNTRLIQTRKSLDEVNRMIRESK